MRFLYAFFLVLSTTTCMAQTPKVTPQMDKLDCSVISTSPQMDDCVKKQMMNSNTVLSNELASFEKRAKQLYKPDPKLGKELIDKVRKAQGAWITFRDLNCSVEAFEIEEGTPAYVTTVNNCIIRMNKNRIEELKYLLH